MIKWKQIPEVTKLTPKNYLEMLTPAMDALSHGRAFLTVKGDPANTMVIGWGTIGYIWNRPVFMVVVRPQRHTYELINNSEDFTVSMPLTRDMTEQIRFAGSTSGRDGNKFEGHGLTPIAAQNVTSPVVKECQLHFECKKLLTQDMTADRMAEEVLTHSYPLRDLHTMYFGEIVSCYTTEE